MNTVLCAENITKDYMLGELCVHALRGVSFTVEEKELIVILGPSGSGTSTMMNILGAIETAREDLSTGATSHRSPTTAESISALSFSSITCSPDSRHWRISNSQPSSVRRR